MDKPCTPAALKRSTRTFFKRHWGEHLGAEPAWLTLDENLLGAIGAGGCYAVVNAHGEVTYVGLALIQPREDKPRRKSGILARLIRHVTVRKALLREGRLVSRREKWDECGGLAKVLVMPFPSKYDYLAAALEVHLIRTFGRRLVMNKSRVPVEAVAKGARAAA